MCRQFAHSLIHVLFLAATDDNFGPLLGQALSYGIAYAKQPDEEPLEQIEFASKIK